MPIVTDSDQSLYYQGQLRQLAQSLGDPSAPVRPALDPDLVGHLGGGQTAVGSPLDSATSGRPQTTTEMSGGGPFRGFDDNATSLLMDAGDLARQNGYGNEGAHALQAVLATEGGLSGAVGDNGHSYGPLQFYDGGQLQNYANALGTDPQSAGQQAIQNPRAAIQWALQNYLGRTIRDGLTQGLTGPALATYVQQHGQVSVNPERAGQWHQLLFANGQDPLAHPITAGAAGATGIANVGGRTSQFGLGLSTADAYAACGPAAAIAFARAEGRNPTVDEAMSLAKAVGWNRDQGMAGPQSEVNLLQKMGVASRLENGVDWSKVASDTAGGNPVIIDTPNHYFYIDGTTQGWNGQTLYHVGTSGTDLKGGSDYMTSDQIAQMGGGARSALYVDHPNATGPSLAEPFDQQLAHQAAAFDTSLQNGGRAGDWQSWSDITPAPRPVMPEPNGFQVTPDTGNIPLGNGNATDLAQAQASQLNPPPAVLPPMTPPQSAQQAIQQAGQLVQNTPRVGIGPGGPIGLPPALPPPGEEGGGLTDIADLGAGGKAADVAGAAEEGPLGEGPLLGGTASEAAGAGAATPESVASTDPLGETLSRPLVANHPDFPDLEAWGQDAVKQGQDPTAVARTIRQYVYQHPAPPAPQPAMGEDAVTNALVQALKDRGIDTKSIEAQVALQRGQPAPGSYQAAIDSGMTPEEWKAANPAPENLGKPNRPAKPGQSVQAGSVQTFPPTDVPPPPQFNPTSGQWEAPPLQQFDQEGNLVSGPLGDVPTVASKLDQLARVQGMEYHTGPDPEWPTGGPIPGGGRSGPAAPYPGLASARGPEEPVVPPEIPDRNGVDPQTFQAAHERIDKAMESSRLTPEQTDLAHQQLDSMLINGADPGAIARFLTNDVEGKQIGFGGWLRALRTGSMAGGIATQSAKGAVSGTELKVLSGPFTQVAMRTPVGIVNALRKGRPEDIAAVVDQLGPILSTALQDGLERGRYGVTMREALSGSAGPFGFVSGPDVVGQNAWQRGIGAVLLGAVRTHGAMSDVSAALGRGAALAQGQSYDAAAEIGQQWGFRSTERGAVGTTISNALGTMRDKGPVTDLVSQVFVPFFNVGYNIYTQGVERSPLGLGGRLTDALQGKPLDSDKLANNLFGVSLATFAFFQAGQGNITGQRPENGAPAWSARVGGQWVPLRMFGPAGESLSQAAALYEAYRDQSGDPKMLAAQMASEYINHLYDDTWLRSMGDVFDTLSNAGNAFSPYRSVRDTARRDLGYTAGSYGESFVPQFQVGKQAVGAIQSLDKRSATPTAPIVPPMQLPNRFIAPSPTPSRAG